MEIENLDAEIPGDFVSELNLWCHTNFRMCPSYSEVKEGPDNQPKYFTKCMIGNHKTFGLARTKKVSKQAAARKMLERMQSGLSNEEVQHGETDDIPKEPEKEDTFNVIEWMELLKKRTGEKLELVKNKKTILGPDYFRFLQELTLEQNLHIKIFEEKKETDRYRSVISINLNPTQIFIGQASTKQKANDKSAEKAIEFFRMVMQ